jgi:hypothetical protein
MARDKGLEDLIREGLPSQLALTEKSMFGGWAWLVDGKLALGARDDGMLARPGKGNDGWALALRDVSPMISRGRRMDGWVRAGPAAYGDAIRLHRGLARFRAPSPAEGVMDSDRLSVCPAPH